MGGGPVEKVGEDRERERKKERKKEKTPTLVSQLLGGSERGAVMK